MVVSNVMWVLGGAGVLLWIILLVRALTAKDGRRVAH